MSFSSFIWCMIAEAASALSKKRRHRPRLGVENCRREQDSGFYRFASR
jgi:hypothetical protein